MKIRLIALGALLALGACTKDESKCADSGCEDTGAGDTDPGPAALAFGVAWTDCMLNVQVTNADQDHTMGIVGANWTGEACGHSTMPPGECKTVIDGANRFESVNDGRMGDTACGEGLDALDEETTWYTGADADQLTYAFWDGEGTLVDCQGPECEFFSP
jgi:hypothetical protein